MGGMSTSASSVLGRAASSLAKKALSSRAPCLPVPAPLLHSAWIRSPRNHAGGWAAACGSFAASGPSRRMSTVSLTIVEPSGHEIKLNAKVGSK
jgi:hypothetical protein